MPDKVPFRYGNYAHLRVTSIVPARESPPVLTAAVEQRFTIKLGRPIVLVGLMGAGKTSVGKRLAAFLNVPFKDSDHEIETAAGMEVREIFEKYGEPHFREGERRVIQRLLAEAPGVLATGGGAFIAPEVRSAIGQKGLSVWLNADLETLWDRVKEKSGRPLLQQANPKQVLSDLLESRRKYYSQADVTVASEADVTHEQMVQRILRSIRAWDLAHPDRAPTLEKLPS